MSKDIETHDNFNMNWLVASDSAAPKPHVTHYLHPTKGWKKGDGERLIQGGKQIPKGYKYSNGQIVVIPRKVRRKIIKQMRQQQGKVRRVRA